MAKKPIALVIFDMAGTTIDEGNVVYKTLRDAIREQGFPCTLQQVLKIGGGQEKKQAIRDLLSDLGVGQDHLEPLVEITYQHFIAQLTASYRDLQVAPCPGSEETFAALRQRGIKVALNTGYQHQTAAKLLQKLGWKEGKQIDLVVTASDVDNSRPAPDMIQVAMDKLGIDHPEQVAKVGDTAIDIEEGKKAGCGLCLGVVGGAQTREQMALAVPDGIMEHLSELLEWVD